MTYWGQEKATGHCKIHMEAEIERSGLPNSSNAFLAHSTYTSTFSCFVNPPISSNQRGWTNQCNVTLGVRPNLQQVDEADEIMKHAFGCQHADRCTDEPEKELCAQIRSKEKLDWTETCNVSASCVSLIVHFVQSCPVAQVLILGCCLSTCKNHVLLHARVCQMTPVIGNGRSPDHAKQYNPDTTIKSIDQ